MHHLPHVIGYRRKVLSFVGVVVIHFSDESPVASSCLLRPGERYLERYLEYLFERYTLGCKFQKALRYTTTVILEEEGWIHLGGEDNNVVICEPSNGQRFKLRSCGCKFE